MPMTDQQIADALELAHDLRMASNLDEVWRYTQHTTDSIAEAVEALASDLAEARAEIARLGGAPGRKRKE